jgi:hypothetical protein
MEEDFTSEIPQHIVDAVKSRSLNSVRDSIRITKTKKVADREKLESIASKPSITREEAGNVRKLMQRLSRSLSLEKKKKEYLKKEISGIQKKKSEDLGEEDIHMVSRRLSNIGSKQMITKEEASEVKSLMKKLSKRLSKEPELKWSPDPDLVRAVQKNSVSNDFRTDSIELQKKRNTRNSLSQADSDEDDFLPDPELLARVQKRSKGFGSGKKIRDSILITKTKKRTTNSKSLSPLMDAFREPPPGSSLMAELELEKSDSV